MKQYHKTILLWVILIIMFISAWHMINQQAPKKEVIKFNEFISLIDKKEVSEVVIQEEDNHYTGTFAPGIRGGGHFETIGPTDSQMVVERLIKNDIPFEFKARKQASLLQQFSDRLSTSLRSAPDSRASSCG